MTAQPCVGVGTVPPHGLTPKLCGAVDLPPAPVETVGGTQTQGHATTQTRSHQTLGLRRCSPATW